MLDHSQLWCLTKSRTFEGEVARQFRVKSGLRKRIRPILRAGPLFIAAATLAACASFSADGGMSVVSRIARQDLHHDVVAIRTESDAADARAAVDRLLSRPLTADAAVAIALLNNRGLQAAYNDLGIAEAKRIGNSLPPNPAVTITRISGAAEMEIEKKVVADIIALVTLPQRAEIATQRFHQAQLRAALETLRTAAQARRAYYRAVAARELVGVLGRAKSAAASTAEVARKLGETGALNKLDQAREQAFYAEATADLAIAKQSATAERERLVRVLGLWGSDLGFRLPDALPRLPRKARNLPFVEREAVAHRLDLQIARMELAALAKSYGLTQATRFVSLLEAGPDAKVTRDKQTGQVVREVGFEASLEIPIYDFGQVRRREAEQTYLQAVNRLMEKAVNVRSEAREAYRRYRSTHDIAAHYQREVLPLRKIISDESQLRFSAMLIDVFALLTEARERVAANKAAVEAEREFWLANADLAATLAGGGEEETNSGRSQMSASIGSADSHGGQP